MALDIEPVPASRSAARLGPSRLKLAVLGLRMRLIRVRPGRSPLTCLGGVEGSDTTGYLELVGHLEELAPEYLFDDPRAKPARLPSPSRSPWPSQLRARRSESSAFWPPPNRVLAMLVGT